MALNVYSIVGLCVRLLLAIIPASVAKKKYYNSVGFYFYGLLALLPSIIHVLCLPDQSDARAKKVSASMVVSGAFLGAVSMGVLVYGLVQGVETISFFADRPIQLLIRVILLLTNIVLMMWIVISAYKCKIGNAIGKAILFYGIYKVLECIIGTVNYYVTFFVMFGGADKYWQSALVRAVTDDGPRLLKYIGVLIGCVILYLFVAIELHDHNHLNF